VKGWWLAFELDAVGSMWAWAAPLLGLAIGVPKVIYMYNRFCRRNLRRIAALERPRIWQFFRPGFFVFLAAMIALGATLSRLALDSFSMLVFVVALDFSLATGLLGSMPQFFRQKAVI
jgi:hypothetical protein